jgi:IS5 family transposase
MSNLLGSEAGCLGVSSKLSRFTSRLVTLAKKAVAGEPDPAYQEGDGGYADWVIVSIHGLKEYLAHPYRRLLDVLTEMDGIVAKLGLKVSELPDFSTVCARWQELKMPVWRRLLRLSADLHELGELQAIDATCVDRIKASQHFAKRTDYVFEDVKTTALVDCETGAFLDIHCSVKQRHDTRIGWQLLDRNIENLETILADKGYDWELLRHKLHAEGVKTVIKHREHGDLDVAHNAMIDDTIYHQRSLIESAFFALKRRFGETVRARTWYGQFRELVLKSAIRNIELDADSTA